MTTTRAAIEQALAGTKHEAFEVMAQGQYDHSLEAFPIRSEKFGVMLTIATPDTAVYVTKEQAAKFLGFDAEKKALEDDLVRVRGGLALLLQSIEQPISVQMTTAQLIAAGRKALSPTTTTTKD